MAVTAAPYPKKLLIPAAPGHSPALWDTEELFKTPTATPATDLKFDFNYSPNIRPIYLESIAYQGKPTRIFAWVGVPAAEDGKPVPGVVLVHGGGGTAFAYWAEKWYNRGYAVIAMDTVGNRPLTHFEGQGCRVKLEGSGPERHDFEKDLVNPHDSWTAQAVAAVVKSHSYLRTLPGVDASRICITGISWGGYLTNIVSAVDKRFLAAVPVYGCGFLGEFSGTVAGAPKEWLLKFDPCMFLRSVECPIHFVGHPVDPPYHWAQWVRSTMLPAKVGRSTLLGMLHSHYHGMPKEVEVYIDSCCKGEPKLPEWYDEAIGDGVISARYKAYAPVDKATIAWTEDGLDIDCASRKWQEAPAELLDGEVRATVPEKATFYYLTLYDARGCRVTTCGYGWQND